MSVKIHGQDYVFVFAKRLVEDFIHNENSGTYTPEYKKVGMHLLPVGVNTDIYYPLEGCDKDIEVSYVSHLYPPEETLQPLLEGERHIRGISEEESVILAAVAEHFSSIREEELLEINTLSPEEYVQNGEGIVRDICDQRNIKFSDKILRFFDYNHNENGVRYFFNHTDMLRKTYPIKTLLDSGIDVKVFGRNWERYKRFSSIAMGPVSNGAELNKVMNRSVINLNMNTSTTYHMRAPEVIASKSFMLTRALVQDDMPITDYFEDGKDVVLFSDSDDLVEKATFYLRNEDARNKIINSAFRRLSSSFSYDKVAENIILTVRQGNQRSSS